MVEGVRDENGWTFASDLSPERLAELQGLVAANGLSSAVGATGDAGDEAFARMVASNPNATVVGGPAGSTETPDTSAQSAVPLGGSGWVFSSDLSPESLAQIQGMIAANGLPSSSGPAAGAGEDAAARAARAAAGDAAFARMVATNPNATVIGGGPSAAPGSEEAAASAAPTGEGEEAFARLLAANPDAKEVAPGVYMTDHDEPPAA